MIESIIAALNCLALALPQRAQLHAAQRLHGRRSILRPSKKAVQDLRQG
jgi:hypothetical protein